MPKYKITNAIVNSSYRTQFEVDTPYTLEQVVKSWVDKVRSMKESVMEVSVHPDKLPQRNNRIYAVISSISVVENEEDKSLRLFTTYVRKVTIVLIE